MKPDEANTIRNRIQMYDAMAAEQHALQRRINTLMLQRGRSLQIHFAGVSDYFDVPAELGEEVHHYLISVFRKRIAALAHEMGELTSPPGTVSHE